MEKEKQDFIQQAIENKSMQQSENILTIQEIKEIIEEDINKKDSNFAQSIDSSSGSNTIKVTKGKDGLSTLTFSVAKKRGVKFGQLKNAVKKSFKKHYKEIIQKAHLDMLVSEIPSKEIVFYIKEKANYSDDFFKQNSWAQGIPLGRTEIVLTKEEKEKICNW